MVSIWNIFTPAFLEQPAHPPVRSVQLGVVPVHQRPAVLQGPHVVVVPQAPVAGEAGGDRLVAAVHRRQVDVDVDEQVALGGAPVDLHVLALLGQPEVHEGCGVLGVVLHQEPVRGEGVEHAVAEGVAQLVIGHPPVQCKGGDEDHVVHAGGGGGVEHRLDDALAHVRAAHRGERQRDVIEGDRQAHARLEQRRQRRRIADRVLEGVTDRRVGVGEPGERLGRVDDP